MKSFSTLVSYSAITLFLVEVLANLRLFERVVFDPEYVEPVTGFLVLLLGNGLFGLFLTSALLLPIRLMEGAGRVDRERLDPGALLIGIVSGLAVIGPMRFHLDWASSEGLMIGLVSLVSGFLGYWLSRRVPLPASGGWQDWAIGLLGFSWWPLMVTLAIMGIGRLHHGYSRSFTSAAFLILILGVLVLAVRLSARKPVLVVVSLVVPLGFSLLAATAIWRSKIPPGSGDLHSDPPDTALSRPSIILIVLDTVRADHLARFGYARDTMPGLERWAERATVGTSAIAPGGWTSPTHASIFSGLSVSDHGVHYGQSAFRTSPREGISWLPEALSGLGYSSVAVTANHLALPEEDLGFDVRISPRRADLAHETLVGYLDERTGLARTMSEYLRWRLPYLDAKAIVDLTIRAASNGGEPLFLFVNLLDAHAPYNPPPSALAELGLAPSTSPGRYWTHRTWQRKWSKLSGPERSLVVDLYDGELRGLDRELSRLLSWVEDTFPEAFVVITSDHGEELGENGRVGHEFGLAQEIIHVPLFIRSPSSQSDEISGHFTEQSERLHAPAGFDWRI